jgi:hypothetical protein
LSFEVVSFELSVHELSETLLQLIKGSWELNSADRLNEAQKTALYVLVVVSQQLVYILVEVLLNGDDHPLWIHLEQQQECQNSLSSQNN